MPQRDLHHQAVRNALVKEGWTITHDPLTVPFGLRKVYLDLGAERLFAADRGSERIAVEVKASSAYRKWLIWKPPWDNSCCTVVY